MKVLYLAGSAPETDTSVTEQLAQTGPQLQITTVSTAAEALAGIRNSGGYHALLTSPTATQNDTLALIATLRRDRVPIAIVPVVNDAQQAFFASAVAAGADDVLVLHGENLAQASETLTRIRQSQHLFPPDERRRLRVLYAGRDSLVWNLLEQVPFVKAERATVQVDGLLSVRAPASEDSSLRCDVVIIDEHPGDAHPLQVVKSVKSQASDLPVVVLTSPSADDIGTAALDLGADDNVIKGGIYRRRLIATLRRVHQRLELTTQHSAVKAREARLRQIVESLPEGVTVIDGSGIVLAMNAEGLALFGASRPKEIVGKDFSSLVVPDRRADVHKLLDRICKGEPGELDFDVEGLDGARRSVELRGVLFERDARDGRGVIAVLRAPTSAPTEWDGQQAVAELQATRTALEEADKRSLTLEETQVAERAEWTSAREQFEARLREAEQAAAGTRREIDHTVAALRDELSRATEARATEGKAWEAARRQLEARLAETETVAGAKGEVERALAAARDEARKAAEAHKDERKAWEAARADLKARLAASETGAAAKTEVEGALMAAHSESLRAGREYDSQRKAWETARQEFEARLREAEAVVSAKTEIESALAASRHDLRNVAEAHAADRQTWETSRRELEARLHETNAAAASRLEIETALAAARDELRRVAEAHAAEHEAWEATRQQLASKLRDSEADAHARADLETALAAARRDFRHAQDVHAAERADWKTTRQVLKARLSETQAAADARAEAEAALAAAQDELRRATEARTVDQTAWESVRRALEQQLKSVEYAQAEAEATLAAARAEFRQAAEAHAAERAAWQSAQQEVETRQHDLRAVSAARAELETTLSTMRVELDETAKAHAAEREAWELTRRRLEHQAQVAEEAHTGERRRLDVARQALEQRLRDLEATAEDHKKLAEALRAARTELAALHETQANDRAIRDRDRAELDALRKAIDDERAQRAALSQALADADRRSDERLGSFSAEHSASRELLETQVRETVARLQQITEDARATRARLEGEVARTSAGHHRLIESGLFGHSVMTLDGRLVSCNDTFARTFGYLNARDALARSSDLPFPPMAGRDRLDARLLVERQMTHIDSCLDRVDGRPVRVLEAATIVSDPVGGPPLVERIVIDMTPCAAIEGDLRQARRIEEVGKLAAAIAPDIQAMVESINASGAELTQALSAADPHRRHAETILAHASHATGLVMQLLAFSRKQGQPAESLDLNDAVRRAESMLRRLIGSHIDFKLRLGKADVITAWQDDLDQLLTTLVVSARDLLPVGGSMVLETSRVELAEGDVEREPGGPTGPHLRLALTASGYGVRPAERSSALDLVAKLCGGYVRATGEPGRSAALQIFLPHCTGGPRPPSGTIN